MSPDPFDDIDRALASGLGALAPDVQGDEETLAAAARDGEHFLRLTSSASAMWTANAATVAPAADTLDGRVHFTPANLCSHLHRSIEPATTARVLKAVFPERKFFAHHPSDSRLDVGQGEVHAVHP